MIQCTRMSNLAILFAAIASTVTLCDPGGGQTAARAGRPSALVLLLKARYQDALNEVRKGLQSSTASATDHAIYGYALYQVDRDKVAEAGHEAMLALQLDPNCALALVSQALVDARAHKEDLAVAELKRAIALDPALSLAHNDLGMIYLSLKDYSAAEPELKRAVQLEPASPEPHSALAGLYCDQGKYAEASEECRCALALDPRNVGALNTAGVISMTTKRYVEAATYLRQAIQLDPKDANIRINLGDLCGWQGHWTEATAEYRSAVQLDPSNGQAHSRLGGALKELKQYGLAERELKEALRLELKPPDRVYAHSQLAQVYQSLSRAPEAETEYLKVIELEPKKSYAHANLGDLYIQLNRLDEAESELKKALLLEQHPASLLGMGRVNLRRRQFDEALRWFTRVLAADPNYPLGFLYEGMALHLLNRLQEAEAALRRELALRPDNNLAVSELAQVYSALHRYAEAEQTYRKAVRQNPRDASSFSSFGAFLLSVRRDPAAAEQLLRKAVTLDPHNQDALIHLAEALLREHRQQEATAVARRAMRLGTVIHPVLVELGLAPAAPKREVQVLLDRGNSAGTANRLNEALLTFGEALRRAISLQDKSGQAFALHYSGVIWDNLGQRTKAIETYLRAVPAEQAAHAWAVQAETLFNLGTQYELLGQPHPALKYYSRSLAVRQNICDTASEGKALNKVGQLLDKTGREKEALEFYGRALTAERAAKDTATEAATTHNIGVVFARTHRVHESVSQYQKAVELWRQVGDKAGEALSVNELQLAYHALGEPQPELATLNQLLALRRAANDAAAEASVLCEIGNVQGLLRQHAQAIEAYRQAIVTAQRANDRKAETWYQRTLANAYYSTHALPEATAAYERECELRREIRDSGGLAEALNFIGLLYDQMKQRSKAMDYYERAVTAAEAARAWAIEGAALYNVGVSYSSIGELDKALDYYGRSLPLRRKAKDRAGEAQTLEAIAGIETVRGDFQRASAGRQTALQLRRRLGQHVLERENYTAIVAIKAALGQKQWLAGSLERTLASLLPSVKPELLRRLRGLDLSVIPMEEARGELAKARKPGEFGPLIGSLLFASLVASAHEEYTEARTFLDEAVALFKRNGAGAFVGDLLLWKAASYDNSGEKQRAADSLREAVQSYRSSANRFGLARSLVELGKRVAIQNTPEALTYFAEAVPFLEAIESDAVAPDQVGEYEENVANEVYPAYCGALLLNNQPEEALRVLERGKARGLLHLATMSRMNLAAVLGPEAEMWRKLVAGRASAEAAVRKAQEDLRNAINEPERAQRMAALDQARLKLLDAERQYALGRSKAISRLPQFAALATNGTGTYGDVFDRILAHDDGSTLVLEFATIPFQWPEPKNTPAPPAEPRAAPVPGEPSHTGWTPYLGVPSRMAVFAASKVDGLKWAWVDYHAFEFDHDSVHRWLEQITSSDPAEPKSARDLYDVLIAPLEKSGLLPAGRFKRLVIIGGKDIADVPFAALLAPSGKRLIESYSLSTAVSMASLASSNPATASAGLLAVANPMGEQEPLAEAEAQARQLVAKWPHARYLRGRDAAKSQVLKLLERFGVLLFQTHAKADPANGLNSYLVLAGSPGQDANLYAHEITALHLTAQLAVLSACETNQGEKSGGEGIMGLAWAFQAAGCPSVVASQWKVRETATASLMTKFFNRLQAGHRLDDALRSAMLSMMRQPGCRSPLYWAAFQVIGRSGPLRNAPMQAAGYRLPLVSPNR